MEGFVLSYTREPTQIPEQKSVDRFLPKYRPKIYLDPKKPMAMGIGVMKEYPYFRSQVYAAQRNALGVIQEAHKEWKRKFGREYSLVESFMMEGAKAALVSMGANSSIAKAAVKSLRSKGFPVGLVRIRVYRPFPREQIKRALEGVEAVGVIDQNLSPGYGGIVYPEIRDCLYDRKIPVSDFIIGLGGRQVSQQEFEQIGNEVLKTANTKKSVVLWQDVV
jgi:pyruvate ferredoxin oxidoreductase alpha subunit